MAYIMLVGTDAALLEGLSQSLAALGHRPMVASTVAEARERAATNTPLVMIVDRTVASAEGAALLALPLAPGGARLVYRTAATAPAPLLPALGRSVLADLMLPLERQRLSALVKSVSDRATTTGRTAEGRGQGQRVSEA